MASSQYHPTRNLQLSDAQEVHYSKDFKQADIAGGYRQEFKKQKRQENDQ